MTTGSPPSITATTLLVVPRSMPTVFAIGVLRDWGCQGFDCAPQAHFIEYRAPPSC
jgi:hypothetical protein